MHGTSPSSHSESETDAFREKVMKMFRDVFQLPGWCDNQVDEALRPLTYEYLHLKRIGIAMTNAVFFVSYRPPGGPYFSAPPTVLLRVYGPGSEALLSRRTELLILHTLSSLYEIGVRCRAHPAAYYGHLCQRTRRGVLRVRLDEPRPDA